MYDLDMFGGDVIVPIVRAHPKVWMNGVVPTNPYYLDSEYLAGAEADGWPAVHLDDRSRGPSRCRNGGAAEPGAGHALPGGAVRVTALRPRRTPWACGASCAG